VHVLLSVILKEFIQLRRDRKMIFALVVGPLLQLFALGLAANLDVTAIPLMVVDQDRTAASRSLLERFTSSGYFDIAGAADSVLEVEPSLVDGSAQVALVFGAGYGDAIAAARAPRTAGGRPRVQLLVDGTDASSAVVGMGYASSIIAREGADILRSRPDVLALGLPRIDLAPRIWYNPDLKSRWFFLPGILAVVLMLTTMVLPSMAVVREKEIGTLEQLSVTPVRPWQLILGKLLPFAMIGMIVLALVTSAVVWGFGVPLRGSFALLALLTLLFLTNTLGLGLLVSTLVRNQQQAMMTSAFVLMVPMIYLSGLIFPIENMPAGFQAATYGIPLRYYNIIIRGIFLKGSGIGVLWPQSAALAGLGAAFVALASLRFRKSLD
jgi:ABC-2 type transport system permease protein